ncbi:hypothetical protein J437_LFUL016125 [Ladona fulva]|uniref:Reverse transcriptase domain-containing protein n=1 Tax=Ladona fulva TaxID=123851 RepID=A0A8K0P7B6_LADFU|nr:hypothetical protein J437_LFUL016125 [Ladona fulva]
MRITGPKPQLTAPHREPSEDQMIWRIELGIIQDGDAATLTRIAEEIANTAATRCNARARQTRLPKRRPPVEVPAAELQSEYRRSKGAAFRRIIGNPSPICPIPLQDLAAHFGKAPPPFNCGPAPSAIPTMVIQRIDGEEENLLRPITPTEVQERIRKAANSTPGPDGIPYRAWPKIDPDGSTLASLYNACLTIETVPQAWKRSRTILLHKGGDADDITNWRPIALQPTMGKIFSGILADRIYLWAIRGRRLSFPFQKGFIPGAEENWRPIALQPTLGKVFSGILAEYIDRIYNWAIRGRRLSFPAQKGYIPGAEGCFEHNFVLGAALEDARRNGKEIAIAWLDLADAFGTGTPLASGSPYVIDSGLPDWQAPYLGAGLRRRRCAAREIRRIAAPAPTCVQDSRTRGVSTLTGKPFRPQFATGGDSWGLTPLLHSRSLLTGPAASRHPANCAEGAALALGRLGHLRSPSRSSAPSPSAGVTKSGAALRLNFTFTTAPSRSHGNRLRRTQGHHPPPDRQQRRSTAPATTRSQCCGKMERARIQTTEVRQPASPPPQWAPQITPLQLPDPRKADADTGRGTEL